MSTFPFPEDGHVMHLLAQILPDGDELADALDLCHKLGEALRDAVARDRALGSVVTAENLVPTVQLVSFCAGLREGKDQAVRS